MSGTADGVGNSVGDAVAFGGTVGWDVEVSRMAGVSVRPMAVSLGSTLCGEGVRIAVGVVVVAGSRSIPFRPAPAEVCPGVSIAVEVSIDSGVKVSGGSNVAAFVDGATIDSVVATTVVAATAGALPGD